MITSSSTVGEGMISSIKLVDAIKYVVGGVGVNQIDDDFDAHGVSFVDEVFEIIRGS